MPESSPEEQFEEVKPLCEMLFDLSAMFIAKQGNFLPTVRFLTCTVRLR
ncbi:MAG: hypothetical protein AAFU86_11770 [Pseudomonadota bacterium]